jgi:hypothetical protein
VHAIGEQRPHGVDVYAGAVVHDVGGGGGHLETSIPEAVADAVKVQGDPEEHQLYRRDSECDIAP